MEKKSIMTPQEFFQHKGWIDKSKPENFLSDGFIPMPEHIEEYAKYYYDAKSRVPLGIDREKLAGFIMTSSIDDMNSYEVADMIIGHLCAQSADVEKEACEFAEWCNRSPYLLYNVVKDVWEFDMEECTTPKLYQLFKSKTKDNA